MRLAALAFSLGIAGLQQQPELPASPAAWGLAGVLLCLCSRFPLPEGYRAPRLACLLSGAFIAGFAWAAHMAAWRLADALDPAWEGRDLRVTGLIDSLPQAFGQGYRFDFRMEAVQPAQAVVPQHIALSWYQGRHDDAQPGPVPRPGERWSFTVRLRRPHGHANPHGFDYEAWLLERGIRASGYVRAAPADRLSAWVATPRTLIERARHRLREGVAQRLPAETHPYAGILLALAIGDQKAVLGRDWDIFNRTGVTHLMSISGLHVTMVAWLVGALLGGVWRRVPGLALRCPAQRAALVAASLAAAGYALLAGFAVPAQRTLLMLLVACAAQSLSRRLPPSRTLCLALVVVLIMDPWAVLAAGFWLSFVAVGALLYVGHARLAAPGAPDWRARLAGWGLTQWTATLASLPLLLLLFQQASLVSPLANALAIPVISFLITPLALLGTALPWAPPLWLAHALLVPLMGFLEALAAWPVWQAPAPPLWSVLVAFAGLAVVLLPRGVPGRMMGWLLLLPALAWPAPRPTTGEAWLQVLDVGQGLAAVVQTAGHTLIYDPGPLYSAESDAGQRIVVPFLRALGVARLDRLIVTHRDSDHAGGTASVQAALPVGDLLASWPLPGARPCRAGDAWTWDGVDFTLLHPAADTPVDGKTNHRSCVLRISAGGRHALLTADIEAADEAALLARAPAALPADVLLVPHHGSRTSSMPAFLAAVGASEAIVPVGYRNRFNHPRPDILARHALLGSRVWRTDRDGAVRVRLGPDGVSVDAERQRAPRYWHSR